MKLLILSLLFISLCFSKEGEYIDSAKVRKPSLAWKLGLIPGAGQIYNGKYLKAIGFIGSEYFAISQLTKLQEQNKIGLRNTYGWWVFGLFIWNILDAYVDAHLSSFPTKRLESNDYSDTLQVILK